jgi:hypothetical protein
MTHTIIANFQIHHMITNHSQLHPTQCQTHKKYDTPKNILRDLQKLSICDIPYHSFTKRKKGKKKKSTTVPIELLCLLATLHPLKENL